MAYKQDHFTDVSQDTTAVLHAFSAVGSLDWDCQGQGAGDEGG